MELYISVSAIIIALFSVIMTIAIYTFVMFNRNKLNPTYRD